jgi:MFS family permease
MSNSYSLLHKETRDIITYKDALKDNTIRGLLIFRVISAMAFGGMLGFLTIFVFETEVTSAFVGKWKTIDPSTWEDQAGVLAGIILTESIFLTGALQIPFGKLADKYNKFMLVLVGSGVATITLIMISAAQNLEQLLLIGVIMAVGSAMSMPAASAIMVKKVGGKAGMGTQMGLFNAAMSIGIITGSLIYGIVTDTLGIESIFLVGGLLSLGGTVAFYLFTRREMKRGDIEPL